MLTKNEIARKIMHILVGIVIIIAYYYDYIRPLTVFLIIIAGILASLISKRLKLPLLDFFLTHLEREEHRKTFPGRGIIFFFIGVLFVMQLFPKDIALASIMILTFGDSMSHIVGEQFGQIKNIFNGKSKKLFEGTVAGTISGFLGALLFVPFTQAFLGSFAAMVAEVIQIDLNQTQLDDNLIVPLVAGTVIYLVRVYL